MEEKGVYKDFVPYESALELKKLGFNELCFGNYKEIKIIDTRNGKYTKGIFFDTINGIQDYNEHNKDAEASAPTFSQVFRFFREKEYYSEINTECTQVDRSIGYSWRIWKPYEIEEWSPERKGYEWSYETYEETELSCLNKIIEIVKTNNHG